MPYSYSSPQKRELTFVHLYGDTIAVLEKAEYAWQLPKIIFPQGFLPEIGKNMSAGCGKLKPASLSMRIRFTESVAPIGKTETLLMPSTTNFMAKAQRKRAGQLSAISFRA